LARHLRVVRVPTRPLSEKETVLDQSLLDRAERLGISLVPPSEREAPPNEPIEPTRPLGSKKRPTTWMTVPVVDPDEDRLAD
jgi:hypothetical protein